VTRAAIAALFAVTLTAVTARAETSRVVVIEDPSDRSLHAANERLRAELVAAGFEVDTRDAAAGDVRGDVEKDAGVATVRRARDASTRSTELWVSDRLTGKTLVRRFKVDPERSPRLVAIRGVELLRASLLELASPPVGDGAPPATPALAAPPPPVVTQLVAAPSQVDLAAPRPTPPKRWASRVSIDAGVAVLASTEGLGAAFAPTLSAWIPLAAGLALRPRVAAPAFGAGLTNAIGTASTHQELATLELAWAPWDGVLVPFVAAGGGAYHLHVDGTASASGYHDASDDAWAAALSGGLGVFVRVAPAVALALDARALELAPHPIVAIGNERVAAAGAPSVLGSASLVAAF
jgi:hypothetical protein